MRSRALRLLILLQLCLASASSAVTFNDGLVHTINAANSYPFEDVRVLDGPGGATTTVGITTGGHIGSGLPYAEINAKEHSTILLSGGTVNGYVQVFDQSHLGMSGGTVTVSVAVFSATTSTITGGQARDVYAGGDATLIFDGASTTGVAVAGQGKLQGQDRARIQLLSGTIVGDVRATQFSRIDVLGGVIGGRVLALDETTITIHGLNFNIPLGNVTSLGGSLTGTLLDGTPLNIEFGRASTAKITLVPEPSVASLIAVGLAGLAAIRRSRRLSRGGVLR